MVVIFSTPASDSFFEFPIGPKLLNVKKSTYSASKVSDKVNPRKTSVGPIAFLYSTSFSMSVVGSPVASPQNIQSPALIKSVKSKFRGLIYFNRFSKRIKL